MTTFLWLYYGVGAALFIALLGLALRRIIAMERAVLHLTERDEIKSEPSRRPPGAWRGK